MWLMDCICDKVEYCINSAFHLEEILALDIDGVVSV